MKTRLERFQLKGLRQILGMDTTWAQKKNNQDMTNKREEIIAKANEALNENRVKRLEDFFYKYREHISGIKIYEHEEVTPPTHLWEIKKSNL